MRSLIVCWLAAVGVGCSSRGVPEEEQVREALLRAEIDQYALGTYQGIPTLCLGAREDRAWTAPVEAPPAPQRWVVEDGMRVLDDEGDLPDAPEPTALARQAPAHDLSAELLQRLREGYARAPRALTFQGQSRCARNTEPFPTQDRFTGPEAAFFTLQNLKLEDDTHASADLEVEETTGWSTGGSYALEKRAGRWEVTSEKRVWID